MERIFLDTNLLLDFVLGRKPFADQAEEIIASHYTHNKRLFTSTLSLANVAYVVRKSGKNPSTTVEELMGWMELVNLTDKEFQLAIKSTFKDFEDALQFYSALAVRSEIIVTRDIKDFSQSTIPVYSPTQFLKTLK